MNRLPCCNAKSSLPDTPVRRYNRITVAHLVVSLLLGLGWLWGKAGIVQGAGGWQPAYLSPLALHDLFLSGERGWAVGEEGTIVRWEGQTWHLIPAPTTQTLHAVAFRSDNDGWAVGAAGVILRFDGLRWKVVSGPTRATDELFDIALVGGTGWIVGQRFNEITGRFDGLILRLEEGRWTEVSLPRVEPLYAVEATRADKAWAVGKAGTMMVWQADQWDVVPRFTLVNLYAVDHLDDTLWAVGDAGFVVRWSEEEAKLVGTSSGRLTGVQMLTPDAGWAVGEDGVLLRYDGTQWSRLNIPVTVDLQDVALGPDQTPWVVGEGGLIGRVGPAGWQYLTQPYLDTDLTAIDMLPVSAVGWAVSSQVTLAVGSTVFWDYRAPVWVPRPVSQAPQLFAVDILAADKAWAVGQDMRIDDPTAAGVVWRYEDGAWGQAAVPGVSSLFAVAVLASDDVWVAGQDGSLAHWGGQGWQRAPLEENIHLYDLHFLSPDEGWAVGEQFELTGVPRYSAVALHFQGSTWQATAVPNSVWEQSVDSTRRPRLLAVAGAAPNDIWAVGNQGAILHFDGAAWQVVQAHKDYALLDLDMANAFDGWAVGTGGTTLHWDGRVWLPEGSGTAATLKGVVSRPRGEAWAVGSDGVFLYHPPRPAVYLPFITW